MTSLINKVMCICIVHKYTFIGTVKLVFEIRFVGFFCLLTDV